MQSESLSVVKTGTTIAVTGVSAAVGVPTDSSGSIPKYIRVAATADCYVKIGPTGVTAAAGDMLIQPGAPIVLKTGFAPFIAAIQVSAAGTVQVSPLEDQ